MEKIIAGHLQLQDQTQFAIDELIHAGFAKEKISAFYVNPPGQHDLFPIGGDRDMSPGAKDSVEGLANGMLPGGIIGASVGMLGIAVAGPLAPVVGAMVGTHIGGFAGSMAAMKEKGETENDETAEDGTAVEYNAANSEPQRLSGMMLAVSVPDSASEERAIRILSAHGAKPIERAEGTIADGDWQDFDPLSAPDLIK